MNKFPFFILVLLLSSTAFCGPYTDKIMRHAQENKPTKPYSDKDKLAIEEFMNEILKEHTDLTLYPELMEYYRNKFKLSFFPKEVSEKNKRSYLEGFMQGGQWIYLRQKITPRKITELTKVHGDRHRNTMPVLNQHYLKEDW